MMDERQFYTESKTSKEVRLNCPYCRTENMIAVLWMVRRKKPNLPAGAGAADRAKFAKWQSYMVLVDNHAKCPNARCRRTFEISGIRTTAFLDS